MSRWRCASHKVLHRNILSVKTDSDQIFPIVVSGIKPPNPNKSNCTLINKKNLFLRPRSISIYYIVSSFNISAGPTLTAGLIISLTRMNLWIYIQSFRPLLSKICSAVADKTVTVMFSARCTNWLEPRLSVQIVTLLTIGSPRTLEFTH